MVCSYIAQLALYLFHNYFHSLDLFTASSSSYSCRVHQFSMTLGRQQLTKAVVKNFSSLSHTRWVFFYSYFFSVRPNCWIIIFLSENKNQILCCCASIDFEFNFPFSVELITYQFAGSAHYYSAETTRFCHLVFRKRTNWRINRTRFLCSVR